MPVIEVRGLTKDYVDRGQVTTRALRGVDLTVEKGEFMAVAGPSGSGKTTLLNLIGALDQATSGTIRVDGHEIGGLSEAELDAAVRKAYPDIGAFQKKLPQILGRLGFDKKTAAFLAGSSCSVPGWACPAPSSARSCRTCTFESAPRPDVTCCGWPPAWSRPCSARTRFSRKLARRIAWRASGARRVVSCTVSSTRRSEPGRGSATKRRSATGSGRWPERPWRRSHESSAGWAAHVCS